MAIEEREAARLGAAQAAAALAAGELRADEYVEALLRRSERLSSLKAWVHLDPEAVLAAVRRPSTGPLHGLPVGVKDSIDTADMPTTAGTPGLDGWRPPRDADVVARLRAAGATVMGKLALHELSSGTTSANAWTGPVDNPYRAGHHAGGSSGGTAAAAAAGLVPAGLGGDTGGSCRIPASICGCVGLRPTLGRWSARGCVPVSSTRDTAGPLARSVADVRLLDDVCASTPQPAVRRDLEGVRIGVPRDPFWGGLDPGTAAVCEHALAVLADHGAVLVDVDLRELREAAGTSGMVVPTYEAPRELSLYLLERDAPFGAREVIERIADATVRAFWMHQLGPGAVDAAAYREALVLQRPALQALYARTFAAHAVQALVLPTTARPAEALADGPDDPALFAALIRNTDPASNAGLPALSVPAGLTDGGLPVGLELVGAAGADAVVLALGEAYEAARGPLPGPDVD